jgi:O-methyltransferase involved in polyketide biosynthesis
MYFEENEVNTLMNHLVDAFPRAVMLFEMMTPTVAKMSKQHDTVKKTKAVFKWEIKDGREIETFNSATHYVREWNYFEYHRNRWRWAGWLAYIPAFKNRFNNRIVHL